LKKIFYVLILLFIINIQVDAQSKGFGLGIIVGEPTGLSGKMWTGSINAFDFAAAWSFKGPGAMLAQADYVWHSFDLIPVTVGRLPLYYGIGGRVIFYDDDMALGVRIPVGLNYIFAEAPIDIFLEVVPVMNLVPSTDFDVNGGLGIRFFFN